MTDKAPSDEAVEAGCRAIHPKWDEWDEAQREAGRHWVGRVLEAALVDAAADSLVGVEPLAPLADVAVSGGLVRDRVVTVVLRGSRLVPFPRFRRVAGFAASHRTSLLDYWGDESLGTAEMPEAM